jgi:hypothetical protein
MRTKFLFLLLLGCLFQSQAQERQPGIAVRPVTIDFTLLPGETATQTINITNGLAEKKQFAVYVSDWKRDTTGAHVYTEPNNDPRSCATWIQLSKNFFELDPGETTQVAVTLKHPMDSLHDKKMSWCMLFIETIQENKVKDTAGITTTISNKFRVGIHIYQTPPKNPSQEIKLLDFQSLHGDKMKYRISCENKGETQLHCTSYLEVVSLETNERIKLPAQEFPIFPEQVRYLDFELPSSLSKGKYLVTAIIDAGMDIALEAAQLQIEIQ